MTETAVSDNSEDLRRQLAQDLPRRVRTALAGYERFTADEPPADSKGFAAWHAAAKAALAHVEALVKLVRWAECGAADPEDGLGRLLAEARQAIDQLEEDSEDP
jgi:hypothetical protein